MKILKIIIVIFICANSFAQNYTGTSIMINGLEIKDQSYTENDLQQSLGLNWTNVKKETEYDGEYHSGYVHEYAYFSNGDFNGDFDFSISISEDNGTYFVIHTTISSSNEIYFQFGSHGLNVGSTTKSEIDLILTSGKELVENDPNHYRIYIDEGVLYFTFDDVTGVLQGLDYSCDCQ